MKPSSNPEERDWLIKLIAGISGIGVTLTGFVLVSLMHLETRVAVLEWRLGALINPLSGKHSLWGERPSATHAAAGFFVPPILSKKEKTHVELSRVPSDNGSPERSSKTALAKQDPLDEFSYLPCDAPSPGLGLCLGKSGGGSSCGGVAQLYSPLGHPGANLLGAVNACHN
jgi:hypothetical protein